MKNLRKIFTLLAVLIIAVGCSAEPVTPVDEVPSTVQTNEDKSTFTIVENEPVVVEQTVVEEETFVDPTQYDYWVVVYDQFKNELFRTTAHYGSTIEVYDGRKVTVTHNTYIDVFVDYFVDDDVQEELVPEREKCIITIDDVKFNVHVGDKFVVTYRDEFTDITFYDDKDKAITCYTVDSDYAKLFNRDTNFAVVYDTNVIKQNMNLSVSNVIYNVVKVEGWSSQNVQSQYKDGEWQEAQYYPAPFVFDESEEGKFIHIGYDGHHECTDPNHHGLPTYHIVDVIDNQNLNERGLPASAELIVPEGTEVTISTTLFAPTTPVNVTTPDDTVMFEKSFESTGAYETETETTIDLTKQFYLSDVSVNEESATNVGDVTYGQMKGDESVTFTVEEDLTITTEEIQPE